MLTAAIIVLLLFVALIWLYNSLVTYLNRVKEAWADIEVQLKRRHNLIPNLVETVKGYAKHERGTLDEVVSARAAANKLAVDIDPANINHEQMAQLLSAENNLAGALSKLFALAENYPDLKANENFLELQRELSDTENKIQAARRFYNGTVRDYNTKIEQFPSNIVAGIFNFTQREFFEVEDKKEREPVSVKF